MSGYGSHIPAIAFEVPNWLHATWIHRTWQTKRPLKMATPGQERQSIPLRVAIYCLLEFLINFICSFHMIVIVIIELNLTSCAQCKILPYRDSRNKAKMVHTKTKKSSLVSGNWPGEKFFLTYLPAYIYLILKNRNAWW